MQNGRVSTTPLRLLLRDLGVRDWDKPVALQPPRLSDESMPVEWVVWSVLRRSKLSLMLTQLAKALVAILSSDLLRAFPRFLDSNLPTCKLPQDVAVLFKNAFKGDDKNFLVYNSFLRRNVGFGPAETQILRDIVYAEHFHAYRAHAMGAMVAAYLAASRKLHGRRMLAQSKIEGDTILMDESRVACQQTMLIHVDAHDTYTCAPLKMQPDNPHILQARRTVRAAAAAASSADAPQLPKKQQGESTYHVCISMCSALMLLLSVGSMAPWLPTSACAHIAGAGRYFDDRSGQPFVWDSASRRAMWCLPMELWSSEGERKVRVLVMTCDEGSAGWSLFQYLAGFIGMRIHFIRDPPHRLSNLFTNALKAVRPVLDSTLQTLLVHKFRRAPFGSGKFWNGLKETLRTFLDAVRTIRHPMIQLLAENIANDHGLPLGSCDNPKALMTAMRLMINAPIGPKVEMRRWFTFFDAGENLDKYWHTMLLALMVWYAASGLDAWKVAASTKPVHEKGDSEQTKQFKFRAQVLITLMNSMNQRIMRSMIICFRRLRCHHARYIKNVKNPAKGLAAFQQWCDVSWWVSEMMSRSLNDALFSPINLQLLGLVQDVTCEQVPLLQPDVGEDVGDNAHLLLLHLRLTMSMMAECALYSVLPQSPPWSFCLLLQAATEPGARAFPKRVFELSNFLRKSSNPFHQSLLSQISFLSWAVTLEGCQILNLADWSLTTVFGTRAKEYIKAMYSGMQNTMGLENGFNDLRDNEARGARHKQRNPGTIQALAISSMATRYAEHTPLVPLTEEHIASCDKYHCAPSTFRAEDCATSSAALGFGVKGIIDKRKMWTSTSTHLFSMCDLSLLHALLASAAEDWPMLWLCNLFRKHMVIQRIADCQVSYVFLCSNWSVCLVDLVGGPSRYTFTTDPSKIRLFVPVTSLVEYFAFDYSVFLGFTSTGESTLGVELIDPPHTLGAYCCINFIHTLKVAMLKRWCDQDKLRYPGKVTQLALVTLLMEAYDIPDDAKEKMLDLVRAKAAKRARPKKGSKGGMDSEGEEEAGEEDEEEDSDDDPEVCVPDPLKAIAPAEVAWFCGGHTDEFPGGAALMEEETDEGLDAIAARAAHPRPRTTAPSPPVPRPPLRPRGSTGVSRSTTGVDRSSTCSS